MHAAIKIGSSQYLVAPGQELLVDRINTDQKQLVFDQVLLVNDENLILVGQPFVPEYSVTAEVVDQLKGPKIKVFKYKAKSRYRKNRGFRASLTKIKILTISSSQKSEKPKVIEKPVKSRSKSKK